MDSPSQEIFLKAQNVKRKFNTSEGNLEVLKGVNLEINKGDMVAVIGESGVGKSTLLHILGGLDQPSEGDVEVDGKTFTMLSETERASFRNDHIGFVFQHHYLLEDFSALENVMIPMLIAGKSKRAAAKDAEQLLSNVGLIERKNHRPKQLSGGEQQRVAVARALANRPGIVLADEPTGNLDESTSERLHRLLVELNRKDGTTFLIATHNKDLAHKCHRIVELKEGRLGAV